MGNLIAAVNFSIKKKKRERETKKVPGEVGKKKKKKVQKCLREGF